jgi:hypothetical protein
MMFLERSALVEAQAANDALVLHLPKEAVFAEIERNPKFARKVIAGLSQRIEGLVRELERPQTLHRVSAAPMSRPVDPDPYRAAGFQGGDRFTAQPDPGALFARAARIGAYRPPPNKRSQDHGAGPGSVGCCGNQSCESPVVTRTSIVVARP